jgi:hypothetical protein
MSRSQPRAGLPVLLLVDGISFIRHGFGVGPRELERHARLVKAQLTVVPEERERPVRDRDRAAGAFEVPGPAPSSGPTTIAPDRDRSVRAPCPRTKKRGRTPPHGIRPRVEAHRSGAPTGTGRPITRRR